MKKGPLIAAVLSDDAESVKLLLRSDEDVNQTDSSGRTALHHAVLNHNSEIVQLLLGASADLNRADKQGFTALHLAAQNHRIDVARNLLEHGAVIDPLDKNGNTPLFRAVFESRGRGDMIRLLLAHGADKGRKNAHGVSPLELARSIANFDVKQWIE